LGGGFLRLGAVTGGIALHLRSIAKDLCSGYLLLASGTVALVTLNHQIGQEPLHVQIRGEDFRTLHPCEEVLNRSSDVGSMFRVDQGTDDIAWPAVEDLLDGTQRILLIERRQIKHIQ
jgi:hypothetical protein